MDLLLVAFTRYRLDNFKREETGYYEGFLCTYVLTTAAFFKNLF